MMRRAEPAIETLRPRRFDVICAGYPLWRSSMSSLGDTERGRGSAFDNVTRILRASGLQLGWAAVLEDDRRGRALLAEMAALDVEVAAVKLAPVGAGLVVVDASWGWSGLVSDRSGTTQVEIPRSWLCQVLLLSGLRPVTSSLAAFCKAARRARRDGTVVVLDLVGSLREWHGQDSRVIAMLLREADIVRCSLFDLAVIGTDVKAVRRAMQSNATLVVDDDGGTTAMGTFADVRVPARRESKSAQLLAESCTAAICAEYARPRGAGETPSARWHRILRHDRERLAVSLPLERRRA